MTLRLRIALRDWDYMTPLALGDVSSDKLDLQVDQVDILGLTACDSNQFENFNRSIGLGSSLGITTPSGYPWRSAAARSSTKARSARPRAGFTCRSRCGRTFATGSRR